MQKERNKEGYPHEEGRGKGVKLKYPKQMRKCRGKEGVQREL